MAIEDSEVAAARPPALVVGFSDVHNDGDAIFIVFFDKSLEGIDGIAFDGPIGTFNKLNGVNLGDCWSSSLF